MSPRPHLVKPVRDECLDPKSFSPCVDPKHVQPNTKNDIAAEKFGIPCKIPPQAVRSVNPSAKVKQTSMLHALRSGGARRGGFPTGFGLWSHLPALPPVASHLASILLECEAEVGRIMNRFTNDISNVVGGSHRTHPGSPSDKLPSVIRMVARNNQSQCAEMHFGFVKSLFCCVIEGHCEQLWQHLTSDHFNPCCEMMEETCQDRLNRGNLDELRSSCMEINASCDVPGPRVWFSANDKSAKQEIK